MIIIDLEIQKCVPPRDGNLQTGILYCKGWSDFVGMGFACASVFDYASDRYDIYDEFMLDLLKETINRAECIVGFNILNFDNKLLEAYEVPVPTNRCYDLLPAIARAAGTPSDFKGLSLGAICQANFAKSKSGDGAMAPILYQQKRFGELFDYCQHDVWLTKKLTDKIIRTGRIINPRTNKEIVVRKPGS